MSKLQIIDVDPRTLGDRKLSLRYSLSKPQIFISQFRIRPFKYLRFKFFTYHGAPNLVLKCGDAVQLSVQTMPSNLSTGAYAQETPLQDPG